MVMKKHIVYLPVIGLGLAAGSAFALNTTLAVSADVSHTNNALKTNTNERSELEQRLAADLSVTHKGNKVTTDVNYSGSRTSYDKNTQEDETEVTGNAKISYEQIAQTLTWTLSNSRASLVRDRSLVNTQTNRDERSITTVDGAYILRPTKADSVTVTAFYTDARYDDVGSQDSDRTGVSAVWGHQISKVDSLFLSLDYSDVSFDTQSNDYEYYSASAGYSVKLSKLSYQISAGYNEQKSSGRSIDGGTLSADVSYSTQLSTVSLNVLHELTDNSIGNNNRSISGLGIYTNAAGSVDSIERSSVDVSYSNSGLCQACTASVSLLLEEESYEILDDDNEQMAFRASFDYQLNSLTTISVHAGYLDFNFTGNNTRNDYNEEAYGAKVSRLLAKNVTLSVVVGYEERDSDLSTENYDELRGGASINYQF
jgi:hypothetical protein